MRLPLIRKVCKTNDFYIERVLPDLGTILVKKGDKVEPFTKVGETFVSYFYQKIDPTYKIIRQPNTYIEKGVVVGEKQLNFFTKATLTAPYTGFVREVGGNSYIFEQDKEHFSLLAGAWGEVADIVENKSVLIKGSAKVVFGAAASSFETEGELVVLPNPSELLEDSYFNRFVKDLAGKIVYSGYFIKLENLKKAIALGVRGIVSGGCDKTTLDYAQRVGFPLVSLSGFGSIPTPKEIFNLFEEVSNRYVFIRGNSGELLIPSDSSFDAACIKNQLDFLTELKSGMIVQVLERPYFGWMGVIDSIVEGKVKVNLSNSVESVMAQPSNLLVVEFS